VLRTRKVSLKMKSCSFSVSANRIAEAAWASNKPINVVNLTTQEVHPDGKYDRYFPVRPLDIHFLIHRVHSKFFNQHKHYRPTESSRSTCHATFLNIKSFDDLASEFLTTGCRTSRERGMFVRYHERRQDNLSGPLSTCARDGQLQV